jgi:hypothetical protein
MTVSMFQSPPALLKFPKESWITIQARSQGHGTPLQLPMLTLGLVTSSDKLLHMDYLIDVRRVLQRGTVTVKNPSSVDFLYSLTQTDDIEDLAAYSRNANSESSLFLQTYR